MLVDLDHLLADPIFQENRCSINFHPLHTYYAMVGYVMMLLFPGVIRVLGFGFLLHMLTDLVDCMMMYASCNDCLKDSGALNLVMWVAQIIGL